MKSIDSNNYKQIVVSSQNYQRLKDLGNFQESFNDIVSKLLNYYEETNSRNE